MDGKCCTRAVKLSAYADCSHWTSEQVERLFSPSESSAEEVRGWLIDSGIQSSRHAVARGRGSVQFNATIWELERLLSTEYHVYEHTDTGSTGLSCSEYYLPSHLRNHVDFITPTVGFHRLSQRAKRARIPRSTQTSSPALMIRDEIAPQFNSTSLGYCSLGVTPACIKALYQIPESIPQLGNELGIINEGVPFSQEDMDAFFNQYTNIPNGTQPNSIFIDGGYNSSIEVAEETTLDLSVAYPIVYPQGIDLFIMPSNADFDNFLDAVDGVSHSSCTVYASS